MYECAGSFGHLDPASAELGRFLKRLQMQQQQVMELIAEKEVEFRARMSGRPYVPPKPIARGLSGMGSFGLASMGFNSTGHQVHMWHLYACVTSMRGTCWCRHGSACRSCCRQRATRHD